MNPVQLDRTVRSAVARHLHVEPDSLSGDTALEALGIDDNTAFALLGEVEDVLDVRFPDDFFDGLHTYGDLTTAVRVAVGA